MTFDVSRALPATARVLIVEDERIIAKDIEQTIKNLGYVVCAVVDTGEEAIRLATEHKPDLVLMDVRIRGAMDGIQAAERIRELISVPIVFLTAFADEATLRRAQGAAPYGYVLKPFDDRDLQVAVMMALAKHKAFEELDQRVRERTDELLRSESRFRHISAVAQLGVFALGSHDLRDVLDRSTRVVCETLGTEYASILERRDDTSTLLVRAAHGWSETDRPTTIPAGKSSQSGYTLLTAEPVISPDFSTETRFRLADAFAAEGIQSGMTVVIHSQGDAQPYGILGTHSRSKRSFTIHEAAFLQAVANLVATTLARVRSENERVAAERAAEQERTRAAQAEEALRQRDEFLSITSHELRTPLTTLKLQLERLQERVDALGSEAASKLRRATRSMERLTRLVEDLLDVSRISLGRLELQLERVALQAVVDDVIDSMRDETQRSGCELRMTGSVAGLVGYWDRGRIEQVLANLLANACKYGAGQPIEVRVNRIGDNAEIRVIDQGPGIACADVERVFGRFERAASIRHYGGLGLGLYISRQIVEAHGGTIFCESKPGSGATFVVRLPAVPHETIEREAGARH